MQDDTGEGVTGPLTVPPVSVSAKSLTESEQRSAREGLKKLRAKYKNQQALADDLGVMQQTVSAALNGGVIGSKLERRIRVLLGEAVPKPYSELPGWEEAAREVGETRKAPPYAIEAVGAWPASLAVERIEPRFVIDLARVWVDWSPTAAKMASETEAAALEMARAGIGAAQATPAPKRGRKTS